jgi:hypothetical protein
MGDFLVIAPEGWTIISKEATEAAGGGAMFAALVNNRGFEYIKEALLPTGEVLEAHTVKDAKVFNDEVLILELVL